MAEDGDRRFKFIGSERARQATPIEQFMDWMEWISFRLLLLAPLFLLMSTYLWGTPVEKAENFFAVIVAWLFQFCIYAGIGGFSLCGIIRLARVFSKKAEHGK